MPVACLSTHPLPPAFGGFARCEASADPSLAVSRLPCLHCHTAATLLPHCCECHSHSSARHPSSYKTTPQSSGRRALVSPSTTAISPATQVHAPPPSVTLLSPTKISHAQSPLPKPPLHHPPSAHLPPTYELPYHHAGRCAHETPASHNPNSSTPPTLTTP